MLFRLLSLTHSLLAVVANMRRTAGLEKTEIVVDIFLRCNSRDRLDIRALLIFWVWKAKSVANDTTFLYSRKRTNCSQNHAKICIRCAILRTVELNFKLFLALFRESFNHLQQPSYDGKVGDQKCYLESTNCFKAFLKAG